MPPPTSGGLAIAQTLGILEAFDLSLHKPTALDINGGKPTAADLLLTRTPVAGAVVASAGACTTPASPTPSSV